jgi:hypothetical protein
MEMESSGAGIYFRSDTKEVIAAAPSEPAPADEGWTKVTDEHEPGLLEVRRLLETLGIVKDAGHVYWAPTHSPAVDSGATSDFVRKFRRTSEEARRRADDGHRGFWARAKAALSTISRLGAKPSV